MSSPNHPTFDIEDAFSSNFPDYIPASPNYVPASPGKTYSSSLNNSFDFDNLKAELRESRTQIAKLQRKQMGNNSKIALARFSIANLEQIIEAIQVRHQADKESLLNAIYEHKNSQEGPSDY
ncbi:hypothetical protein Tco_0860019 [Tanacetum coccineum]|uniref:Uncharacterized protein n=1 Tax=Tanacetum coccineum TaxID=301880 RepID=A0ABQ5BG02_9ASTR